MLRAHSFDPGVRYSDHISGDKLAGYGIASLVAVVAGAKVAKAAGLGALIVLLKKFAVVIVAAAAGLFTWVWRLISGRS